MNGLPEPLVPEDCDLTCYAWFTLHHRRLKQSEWWLSASDIARSRNVDLWCEAMDQIPAASLPDSDVVLARFAGYGRDADAFRAAKAEIMAPWVLCSDGRWYHPTLAETALSAWGERRLHNWKRECDRIRKENFRRAKEKLDPLELPPQPAELVIVSKGNKKPSGGKPQLSAGNSDPAPGIPAENALTGQDLTGPDRTGPDPTTKNLDANASLSTASVDAGPAELLVLESEKPKAPSRKSTAAEQAALDAWNELAARYDLPAAIALSDKRSADIRARLRDGGGLPGWADALQGVSEMPHTLGQNDRGWKATIDFVSSPSGFLKCRERAFGRGTTNGSRPGRPTAMDIAMAGMERDENGDLIRQ